MKSTAELYEPLLCDLIKEAFSRLKEEINCQLPWTREQLGKWMNLSISETFPHNTFQHPDSYPMLLLPWYLAKSLDGELDLEFQTDVIYSTVAGYRFIRLVDNVMDGEAVVELKLLPAAGLLFSRFQAAYHRHFEHDHPFWACFQDVWSESVDATVRDAFLSRIEISDFINISGRKFAAGKIPIAAVCHRYGRPDLVEPWFRLLNRLGCWSQMLNDLFDWEKDEKLGLCTFLLSESQRRRFPGELLAQWMAREGFDWGLSMLAGWMGEMRMIVGALKCPEVEGYLHLRERALAERANAARRGLTFLSRLLEAFRSETSKGALHGAGLQVKENNDVQ